MRIRRFTVSPTTIADGSATAYTPSFSGYIHSIQYVKPGVAADYAAGVDFTITTETTGLNLYTLVNQDASALKLPRFPTHDGIGAASLYAAGGEPVEDMLAVSRERVKIVIANGGDTKTGTFYVTVVGGAD